MSGGHYTAAVRYYGHPMSTYPKVEEGSKNSNPTAKVHIDTMPNHDSPDDNAGSPVIAVGAIKLNVSDPSVGSRSSVPCAGADDSARAVGRDKDGASSNKQRARHPQSTRSSHSVSAMLKNIIGCQSIEGVTFDNGTELFDILPDLQQKAVKGCIGQVCA